MAKKILVIDDEELIIKSLSRLLEKNGYEVFVAKNGQDAIIMTEEEDFDLILADIRMPGMNGVDTIQSIYEGLQSNNLKKIPIIFITGYADEKIKRKADILKPIAYIYKPFDMVEILDKIKKAVG
ncbi:MAG: response regulator [Candidatus Omnitrophica bacterium]|nr:response regulator [Candidatus Omnitrophota bacterium]MBU4473535.1 response regulator [Candidatus Omnitrophota bacterium]MCG2706174.1 response regulator [Candidatus Omnitrophota bacterium]